MWIPVRSVFFVLVLLVSYKMSFAQERIPENSVDPSPLAGEISNLSPDEVDLSTILKTNREIIIELISNLPEGVTTVFVDDMCFSVQDFIYRFHDSVLPKGATSLADELGVPNLKAAQEGNIWPNGNIRVAFSNSSNEPGNSNRWINDGRRALWMDVADEIGAFMNDCITFTYDDTLTNNRIFVFNNVVPGTDVQSGTWSNVGFVGDNQMAIDQWDDWKIKWVIGHEIFHALGLTHEHQRPDRNLFINVTDACTQNNPDNFNLIDPNHVTIRSSYDFDSLTHYSGGTYSTNCEIQIKDEFSCDNNANPCWNNSGIDCPNPWNGTAGYIGQRCGPSKLDVLALKDMYACQKDDTLENSDTAGRENDSCAFPRSVDVNVQYDNLALGVNTKDPEYDVYRVSVNSYGLLVPKIDFDDPVLGNISISYFYGNCNENIRVKSYQGTSAPFVIDERVFPGEYTIEMINYSNFSGNYTLKFEYLEETPNNCSTAVYTPLGSFPSSPWVKSGLSISPGGWIFFVVDIPYKGVFECVLTPLGEIAQEKLPLEVILYGPPCRDDPKPEDWISSSQGRERINVSGVLEPGRYFIRYHSPNSQTDFQIETFFGDEPEATATPTPTLSPTITETPTPTPPSSSGIESWRLF